MTERRKGWKKEGKSAEREAVIEAIQHWIGRHFDKLHALPWLPVACVSSLSCIPPRPNILAFKRQRKDTKGGRERIKERLKEKYNTDG